MNLSEKFKELVDTKVCESEDVFTTEITFLAQSVNNELSNFSNKTAKRIAGMIYDALLKMRDGDIDGAKKLLKKVI